VVAPDAAQPVGDLAAPLAVDDADEVQRPRGNALLGLGVALRDEMAQRLLDRRRRGLLRTPDRVGGRAQDRPPNCIIKEGGS
jgi:hypothetical protein